MWVTTEEERDNRIKTAALHFVYFATEAGFFRIEPQGGAKRQAREVHAKRQAREVQAKRQAREVQAPRRE